MTLTRQRIEELANRFAGKKILVVGDTVLDRYVFGNVERLNPEAPVPILHAKTETVASGGAGNTAKNAAQLQAAVTLISVTGDDKTAQTLTQQAQAEGYQPLFVVDSSRPTIEKVRYLVRSQQMLRVDYEETHNIAGDVEAQVINHIKEAAAGVDAIIVSDYAKGVITENVALAVKEVMVEHNLFVLADVKPSHASLFTGVSAMAPNRKEAHEYLGINQFEKGGRSHEELARMVQQSFATTVYLTLSEQGIFVLGKDAPAGTHLPVQYVAGDEVVDPSGCGDTVSVAIALGKLAGATDEEAGELANMAAAVVAKKIGSVGASVEEILALIAND